MGHDAFVERYEKPNFKIHIIVFLAIVAVSIFLATQVEKSKDITDIAALKSPVPIDSIEIVNSGAEEKVPTIKSPVINKNLPISTDVEQVAITSTEQEYAFDDGSNLESINQLLAADDDSNSEKATVQAEKIAENKMSAEESLQKQNLDASSASSMDQVYQQQQDRFLETLAKSAELETQEPIDIKKLKEAIANDKPLVNKKQKTSGVVAVQTTKSKPSNNNSASQEKNINTKKDNPTVQNVVVQNTKTETSKPVNLQKARLITSNELVNNKIENPVMTKGELDSVVSQFARSYNEGDINRLMALFTENASTNDRKNKIGIKADYAELFNNTQTRNLMIKDVKWRLGKDRAEGAANFVVTVQPKNSPDSNLYKGYIKITAIKHSKGVYITRLIHELKQ